MVLTQIMSDFIKFGPRTTNSIQLWCGLEGQPKKQKTKQSKKNDNCETTTMEMENKGIFTGIP